MNKRNFDTEMQNLIEKNKGKKLLLHSCCAPCSTACIERLKDFFDITVYYYNPNIDSDLEYNKRLNEQIRYCDSLGIKVIGEDHNSCDFYDIVKGLENEKEGGSRCEKCFYLRLNKTANKCKELGFDFFATTLTVSPLKNSTLINEIGESIEKITGAKYLVSDFKKKDGYKRSVILSNENSLYRQNYCGCEFSKRDL